MIASLDVPVSPSLVDVLRSFGYDGVHAVQIGLAKATDTALLDLARNEQRIVITADLDFPRLLALSSADGPGLIPFRGGNYSEQEMRELLARVLTQVTPEILERSICVVDKQRIRLTTLPVR
jgi:predicted nuclease of predicted toxin-antitoxin system